MALIEKPLLGDALFLQISAAFVKTLRPPAPPAVQGTLE
jgi:hypothetical protein